MEALVPAGVVVLIGLVALLVALGALGVGVGYAVLSARKRQALALETQEKRYRECADFDEALARLVARRAEVAGALDQARQGLDRVNQRMDELDERSDRDHVVEGYQKTRAMLLDKQRDLELALASTWRTMAVLTLRKELARVTRNRPELDGLPEQAGTDQAVKAWRGAAYRVREAAKNAVLVATQLEERLPARPKGVELGDQVEEEILHVRAILSGIGRELERLADELALVVEHQRALSIEAGAHEAGTRTLAEVLRDGQGALEGLDLLAEVGQRAVLQLEDGDEAVDPVLRREEAQVLADAEVGRTSVPLAH